MACYVKFLDNIDPKTTATIRSKQEIRTHFPDILDDLGKFPWKDIHISIDKDVPPLRTAPRSVPVHQEKVVKEEIDRILASGVIVPIYKTCIRLTPL